MQKRRSYSKAALFLILNLFGILILITTGIILDVVPQLKLNLNFWGIVVLYCPVLIINMIYDYELWNKGE